MSFKEVIDTLHWKDGLSLFELSLRCGVSRDAIYRNAKKLGLKTMSRAESAKSRHRHHKHWATGLNKENSDWARRSSERMLLDNPIKYRRAANKRAETLRQTFSKNLWPQEKAFKKILDNAGVIYEMQKPIGKYNIDFFIPKPRLCIEIDSTNKWGKERRAAASKKDEFLNANNFKVIRINKNKLNDPSFVHKILKANNVI